MTIYEAVKADIRTARLARDQKTLSSLSTLLGELDLDAKVLEGVKSTSEADSVAIVKKFLKNLDEVVKASGSTPEIENEKVLYSKYLPQQLSETEIRSIIIDFKEVRNDPKLSLGEIMAHLKNHHSGLYDGKVASQVAKELV